MERRTRRSVVIAAILVCVGLLAWLGMTTCLRRHTVFLILPTLERIVAKPPQPIAEDLPHYKAVIEKIAANSRTTKVLWGEEFTDRAVVYRADIDGDGARDMIMGIGALAFVVDASRSGRRYGQTYGNSGIESVGFDDVDGDGSIDAWLFDAGDRWIGILWGDGKGHFVGMQRFSRVVAQRSSFFDFNKDGNLDIIYEVTWHPHTGPLRNPECFWIELEPKAKRK